MVKLPLGFLMEECIQKHGCQQKSVPAYRWITRVEALGIHRCPDRDTLYIQLDDSRKFEGILPGSNILVLLREDDVAGLPAGMEYLSVPGNEDLFTIMGELQDLFTEFRDWQDRLLDECSRHSSLQDLINLSASMTPNHIYISDMSFKILVYTDQEIMREISATWRYQLAHGYLPVHVMKGMIENGEFDRLNGYRNARHVYSENFNVPFVTKNIFCHNRPQAHLFVVNSMKRPQFRDIAVAQMLGEFLEEHYFILSEFKLNHTGNNYEAFFSDALSDVSVDSMAVERQISLFEWKMDDSYMLSIINLSGRDENFCRVMMYQIEEDSGFMSFLHDEHLVVLANLSVNSAEGMKNRMRKLSDSYSLEICIGREFKGFLNIREDYNFLIAIMSYAQVYGKGGMCYDSADYYVYHIVDRVLNMAETRRLCSEDALMLQSYDHGHDTDYFDTYYMYLLYDRNIVRASQKLHIHRNTLMYRLDKIHDLIHLDEENIAQKVHMLMSMMMLQHQEKFQIADEEEPDF
ncbi:MAG: helix-turn-helix domain-containing protein [Lachnospiraceae bacterium]|nr:helix-turn-helix domain-containing protein [Lachnospiraceae bacterium]